jgi:hypothetical protein
MTIQQQHPIVTPMQAAAANPEVRPQLRLAQQMAKRLLYNLKENEIVDVVELQRVLAASDNILARMELKTILYKLNLIPA